jgi:hypothetical protein
MKLIYCDGYPSEQRGGFFSILMSIVAELRSSVVLVTPYSRSSSPIMRSFAFKYIPFLSHRLAAKSFLVRAPLLLYDVFLLAFCLSKAKNTYYSKMVVFVGNDWITLMRGYVASRILKVDNLTAYFVDDFTGFQDSGPANICLRNRFNHYLASLIIKRYDRLFFVSEGLRERFRYLFRGIF